MTNRAGLVWMISSVLVIVLACVPEGGAQLLTALEGEAAFLDRETVPAAGEHAAVLSVRRFGRFTITVSSEEGVALQLVDRMAGPGPMSGSAGEADGRLDVFLDRGEYRILTHGHTKATGEATLAVHPFMELNADRAPQLVEVKPVESSLADLEQRSYWLQVAERRWVHLEVAGRALADLRLWRDGSWLMDAEAEVDVVEPSKGRPLAVRRMVVQLEPGLYLLSAYGGEPQPWAEGGEEFPLHLRFGIQTLATAGRSLREVGPMGIDRFLVPSEANYYRIELPEASPASLRVSEHWDAASFAEGGRTAAISKDSRVPAAEVDTEHREDGWNQVVVRAPAGQSYVLQHFESLEWYNFDGSGEYWISSVHSGHPEDSVDATGIIAHWDPTGRMQKDPLREQTITVDGDTGWATRCNLLAPLTIFLNVAETGAYTINSQGVEASFRVEPFFVYRPRDYQAPPFRRSGHVWSLDAGFYVLTARPEHKGILEMEVKPDSLVDNLLALIGFSSDVEEEQPVHASVRFESVPLEARHNYTLYHNRQPGVRSGLVLRSLPVALGDALPLTIRPGEEVEVPFRVSEESLVQALTEGGGELRLSVNNGDWVGVQTVAAGSGRALLRNDGEATIVCSLEATPTRLLASTALPPLPQAALDALPDFPELRVDDPLFFDLARVQNETVLLTAEADALYRLETTGLLDTEGTVRSRTNTSLATSSAGGSGRNFFLHQVLLAGTYQVSVSTQGDSAGHLGLRLTRTDPEDGGELEEGLPVRLALAAGETVAYRFRIDSPGEYRLRSQALGRSVRCRLTDGDGWPLLRPGGSADITRWFDAGEYRLVLLPEPVAGRRLTLLERIPEPMRFEGHGPHLLPLDARVRHRWMEPEPGGERLPDIWSFSLPAPGKVEISLSPKMTAVLRKSVNGADTVTADLLPGRGFDGLLEAGEYRLELVSARPDNLLDYEISVRPEALMAGMARTVTAPATLPVSVGRTGQVEISSLGDTDVRARLEDGEGRVLYSNDDRPGDWNFLVAANLDPGQYTLQILPVGSARALTTVRVDECEEQLHQALALPADLNQSPGRQVHVFPVVAEDGELLLASARSADAVGLAVERRVVEGWQTVAARIGREVLLGVPVRDSDGLRLRIWSVDRRGEPARLMAASVAPQKISEQRLARGLVLSPVAGFEPAVAVAQMDVAGDGVLRLDRGRGVRWSRHPELPLAEQSHSLLPMSSGRALLSVDASSGVPEVQATRVFLEPRSPLQLSLDPGDEILVDLEAGGNSPVVVRVQSTVAQPVVLLADREHIARARPVVPAVADGGAVSVLLSSSEPMVRAWVGSDEDETVDLRLTAFAFEGAARQSLGYGVFESPVESGKALTFDLPKGQKNLRLTLSPDTVAALHSGDAVRSVHWGDDLSSSELLGSAEGSVTVFALGDAGGRFAIEILAASRPQVALSESSPLERQMTRGGRLRVPVAESTDHHRTLSFAGNVVDMVFISDDGRVLRGENLEIGTSSGSLLVDHEPGPVAAWFGSEDGLWAGTRLPRADKVKLPTRFALEDPVQRFEISNAAESLLEVECTSAAVFRLVTASRSSAWLELGGAVRHLLAPSGDLELAARTFGGGALDGELALRLVAVSPTREGLGPERLLAPGEGHAYRFTVDQAGAVGVGVRSDPDTAECELMTADGEVLGDGVVQMHELEVGEYLLVISAPVDSGPVRVRPAVVGIEKPPSGPPEDIVRGYLDMERSQQ